MRKKRISSRPPSSGSTAKHCRAEYLDDSQIVIQVFVPWQGRERRTSFNRRQMLDRRDLIRYEPPTTVADAPGDRRGYVDRRQHDRFFDAYRMAKFNRQYKRTPHHD